MTRPTLPRLTMARALVFVCLAATAGWSPAAVLAAEIAWQQVTKKKAETKDKVARAGTATLSDGQQASVAAELTFGPKDLKDRQTQGQDGTELQGQVDDHDRLLPAART